MLRVFRASTVAADGGEWMPSDANDDDRKSSGKASPSSRLSCRSLTTLLCRSLPSSVDDVRLCRSLMSRSQSFFRRRICSFVARSSPSAAGCSSVNGLRAKSPPPFSSLVLAAGLSTLPFLCRNNAGKPVAVSVATRK